MINITDENKALEEVQENAQDLEPSAEEVVPSTESPTAKDDPETEDSSEAEAEEEPKSKKDYSTRVRELNEKAKAEKARADSLAEQVRKLTQGYDTGMPQYQYQQEAKQYYNPETGEIDAVAFEQNVLSRAQAITNLQIQASRNAERVSREAEETIKSYPELDPDSDSFDEELSASVSEAGMAYVRANPTQSLKKFVDGLMKPYRRSIENGVGEQREAIAKQVSEKALRPTQSPKGEKPLESLTPEELEERLGRVF